MGKNKNKKESNALEIISPLRRYSHYQKDKSKNSLTTEECVNVEWVNYKIVVPTQDDKEQLELAFEHIHYADIDTDIVAVNQLAHEYLDKNNIAVNNTVFGLIDGQVLRNKLGPIKNLLALLDRCNITLKDDAIKGFYTTVDKMRMEDKLKEVVMKEIETSNRNLNYILGED